MKSKLTLIISIVVFSVVGILLSIGFDEIGVDTKWSTEGSMSFSGVYSMLVGVLLGVKTYWLLDGKVPGYREIDRIEQKTGWWYFLVGSTVWVLTIYLVELVNIKPAFVAGIIDVVITVSIVYFLYKHFSLRIKSINKEINHNKAIEDALESDIKKTKDIIVSHMNERRSNKIKEIIEKALNEVLELLDEIQGNIHFVYKEIPNVKLPEDDESVMELEDEISSTLNSFNTSISWDVKKEIQEAAYALEKAGIDQLHSDEWLDHEIFANIDLTTSYMQSDFVNLDEIVKKLENYKGVEECRLLRALVTESVTNMLVANNKINETRKLLFDEINSIK
jgi:hypothetical protein